MLNGKKIVVVLPAYNAALTLERTYNEIPFDIVDDVVLVDDNSPDEALWAKESAWGMLKHIVKTRSKQRLRRQPEKLLQKSP